MATSDVSIANRALQKLGARAIASFGEDSANARSVSIAYEPVRDKLLREYAWNFAIKRVTLAADAAQTTWGGLNRFAKPADFLRLLRGKEAGTFTQEARQNWRIEGDYVVTADAAPLELRYVAKITDPTKFDALFAELLAVTLAVDLTGDIEVSQGKKQILLDEMVNLHARAKSINAQENDSEEPPEDEWLSARR